MFSSAGSSIIPVTPNREREAAKAIYLLSLQKKKKKRQRERALAKKTHLIALVHRKKKYGLLFGLKINNGSATKKKKKVLGVSFCVRTKARAKC